jgi:hypothetical protein
MTEYFSVDRTTIKSILERELGLRKFTRIWVSHISSAEQKIEKNDEIPKSVDHLSKLYGENFQEIITGSWRNSQSDSRTTELLHFRRFLKYLQSVDGGINLGDCKQ